jgi:hypothetical protein
MKIALFLMPVALVLTFGPRVAAHDQDGTTKTVYATWLDKDGKAITDLGPDEIAVFEDGMKQPRQLVSMKRATTPLSIVMLADTSAAVGGAGLDSRSSSATSAGDMMHDIRAAFSEFAKTMLAANPKNELALMEFGQASIMITDFTSNGAELEKSVMRLNTKPNAASVLLEGIMESSKELGKRPNARRAIIALNVMPDNEQSREPANNIMKELAKDRAAFFSVSLQKGDLRNASRGPILAGYADKTGGKRDVLVGQSALVDMLKSYADILNAQYEIAFMRPVGAPPQLIQLATAPNRGAVKILHSKFPPQ